MTRMIFRLNLSLNLAYISYTFINVHYRKFRKINISRIVICEFSLLKQLLFFFVLEYKNEITYF